MEMENNFTKSIEPIILLGRPFMATTKIVIDVHNGKLSMTMLGETVQFDVFRAMPLQVNENIDECSYVDDIDECIEDFFHVQVENKSES